MDRQALPPLEWIRVFESAARLGSFTAAAREAGLTQAAVSQRIGHLERHLGTRLFHRRARTIELTVDGEAWLPHVRLSIDGLRESAEALFGSGREHLKLSVSQSVLQLWLVPRLPQLMALTDAELSLQTFVTGAYDAPQDEVIRIRYGTGAWPHPLRARLYAEEIAPMAAPALCGRSDPWTAWPRITCAGPRPGWGAWATAHGIPTTPVPKMRFDTHVSACSAALAGLGVFMGSVPLCAEALQKGALVRLDTRAVSHEESYWMLAGPKALGGKQWQVLSDVICAE